MWLSIIRSRFNPLAGIRCFLTATVDDGKIGQMPIRFNPLAGIRCFLTEWTSMLNEPPKAFQSPSGDSLFSDNETKNDAHKRCARFNPLAGIRCFLTKHVRIVERHEYV